MTGRKFTPPTEFPAEYAVGLAPLDSAIETARTTLAELKGEKHE